jgi:hypothetical protein
MEGIHEILSALYSSAEGSAEIAVSLVAALIRKSGVPFVKSWSTLDG